jgi:crotonobetaine/carnitine-CoA ligase
VAVSGWGRPSAGSLAPLLAARVAEQPDKTLFSVDGRPVSYAALDGMANAFAHRFLELGVEPGDTVATLMLNCEEIVASWFACAKVGAIHAPMHTQGGEQLVDQLRTAGSRVVLADHDLALAVTRSADQLPEVRHLFVRGAEAEELDGDVATTAQLHVHPIDDLRGEESDVGSARQPRWDDISVILFTGGTTGRSKGVAMSHNYVLSAAAAFAAQVAFDRAATMGAVVMPLLQGGTGATELAFDPATYWTRVHHYRATAVSLRMPMVVMLLAASPRDDDRDNPVRYSTSPQLPRAVRLEFEERFAMQFVHSYANSECIPILVGTPGERPPPGRSGKPSPDLEVRLFDDDDCEVAPGEVGEFVVRPRKPCIMFSGYYRNDEATVRAWRNLWFHTGDLGRVHDDGWWSVVDRKGDELRVGDEVYSTFEIEGSVLAYAGVKEGAVFSLAGADGPEVKLALRVGDDDFDHARFVAFCEERLPVVPRYVEVVDDFPRGAASRVQKYKLREQGLTPATWDRVTASFCA